MIPLLGLVNAALAFWLGFNAANAWTILGPTAMGCVLYLLMRPASMASDMQRNPLSTLVIIAGSQALLASLLYGAGYLLT